MPFRPHSLPFKLRRAIDSGVCSVEDIARASGVSIKAIRQIMSNTPVPIVVVSSYVNHLAMNVTFDALHAGALDVVQKPELVTLTKDARACERFIETLRAMASVKVIKHRARRAAAPVIRIHPRRIRDLELVAIGASAGGPLALATILGALPADFSLPVVITQHMIKGFIVGATQWLDALCQLTVKVATHGQPLHAGAVYFAPDDGHLRISRAPDNTLVAQIGDDAAIGGFRPSITALLESAARTCGARAVGGILTGMGHDGDQGLLAMRQAGALTFAQDKNSSMIFGMPKAAIDAGAARHTLALDKIAAFLCNPENATADSRP